MRNYEEIFADAIQWQLNTFKNQSLQGKANHLYEEAKELRAEPTDGEEMADIVFLLIGIAHLSGVNLKEEIEKKLAINKARTWGEMDEDGIVHHIE